MHHSTRIYFLLVAVIALALLACATVVKPTGGSTDKAPPELLQAYPADSTINFTGNKIILEFDEFVKLNNPRSQVLMNPFIGEDVDITAKGKKIIIKLPDSLADAGTYHIFFGNSVQDITESNISTNMHYVFSTGPYLDSCTISGFAINAFENTSNDEAWVLLHNSKNDIKDTTPVYLAHSNEKGAFVFSNLKPGTYHALALVDANSDYIFNLATELIGFYPEPIVLDAENTRLDSLKIRLFENADTTQKKIKNEVIRFRTVRIGFKESLKNPQVSILMGGDVQYEWDNDQDTIIFWLPNRTQDSLGCIISDGSFADTIYQDLNVKLRNNKVITDTTFKVLSNLHKGKLIHTDTLVLEFTSPITSIDTSKMMLISGEDTVSFNIEKHDSLGREWAVLYEITPDAKGTMILDKGAFTNIFGHSNDSTALRWQCTKDEDFGSLILTLGPPPSYPFILEISGSEGYQRQYLEAWTDTITFIELFPGAYKVKLTIDKNKDGEFTTGDFDSDRQPEPVYTLPRPVSIRANWESRNYWSL